LIEYDSSKLHYLPLNEWTVNITVNINKEAIERFEELIMDQMKRPSRY